MDINCIASNLPTVAVELEIGYSVVPITDELPNEETPVEPLLNINDQSLTARQIADALPGGIGNSTARKILNARNILNNQKFENSDALKSIPNISVNWDEVLPLISFE